MNKAIIKHFILDQPFNIPMRIRKQLNIQKNIFELNQPQLRKSTYTQIPIQQQPQLVDPLVMDSALIKSLLFGKMESYLIFISIIVSGLIVYKHIEYEEEVSPNNSDNNNKFTQASLESEYDQQVVELYVIPEARFHLLLLQTFITSLLVITNLIGVYFQTKTNQTRGLDNHISTKIIKLVIILFHPNIWIQKYNFVFHLFLILRLPFLISYWIKSSAFHSNRSFRLTEIYGIKPNENFMFAIKSIVQQMTIKQVVAIYIFVVFVFSHCLFLAGLSEPTVKPFWTCFEIIIVTLPTIGYGQYQVTSIIQRGIILIAVVVGACLNSLITLIMLKQFQMSSQQTYSYNLLHKLNLKQRMQNISRQYIVNTMQQLKQTNFNKESSRTESRKQLDNRFKNQYKYLKTRYTEISTRDLNSMFDLFKEELKDFKVNCQQMNNMIYVLLTKLHKLKHYKKETNYQKKLIFPL